MDAITIGGMEVLLDEEDEPPFLELGLQTGSRTFTAVILAAEDLWALNMRDENNQGLQGAGELYATQADAILAAMLTALHLSSPLGRMQSS